MTSATPDRSNIRLLFLIALVGAVLAIVGWVRYFR